MCNANYVAYATFQWQIYTYSSFIGWINKIKKVDK